MSQHSNATNKRVAQLIVLSLLLCSNLSVPAAQVEKQASRGEGVVAERMIVAAHSTRTETCSLQSCILVFLGDGAVNGPNSKRAIAAGDVQLMRSGSILEISSTARPLSLLRIGIADVKITEKNCTCHDPDQDLICGCRDSHLPPKWNATVAGLTLEGVLLKAGQELQDASSRNKTLVVAVTDASFRDVIVGDDGNKVRPLGSSRFHLARGMTHWLKPGIHWLKNTGQRESRLITIEF
jgi:hypothetical protein